MYPPIDMVTKQGFDLQFGTNVLGVNFTQINTVSAHSQTHTGHFYLTKLLLPLLLATAKKVPPREVRVINVSSIVHLRGAPDGIRWTSLSPGNDSLVARKELGTMRLYGQSKLVRTMPLQLIPTRYLINMLFCREISYSRTNSPGDMAKRGLCPSRYTQESSSRISCAILVHSYSLAGGQYNILFHTEQSLLCTLAQPPLLVSSMAK